MNYMYRVYDSTGNPVGGKYPFFSYRDAYNYKKSFGNSQWQIKKVN